MIVCVHYRSYKIHTLHQEDDGDVEESVQGQYIRRLNPPAAAPAPAAKARGSKELAALGEGHTATDLPSKRRRGD